MRIISGTARGTKLYTLDGDNTRPTLDRVKEALFSKINIDLTDSIVLDLFSGSGALGLESLSRGAKKAYFCDSSKNAIKIIEKNIEKTRMKDKSVVIQKDFLQALEKIKQENVKFNIIFLDPPYKTDYNVKALNFILDNNLLYEDGKIIIETDIEKDILAELENFSLDVYDVKKYGRATLIFIRRKG
jgi:16S rRNA (guanine(966)-N(2))-methyltransferase RsmD